MLKLIKSLLLRITGLENYLSFISLIYIRLILSGFFKKKYPELHFIKSIVKPGDFCIDIGANLGYYSIVLGKTTGNKGKVWAIEPVKIFADVLKKNIKRFNTSGIVEVLPYALGSENKSVKMATPVIEGVFRHGLTKVLDNEKTDIHHTYEVEMKNPGNLFSNAEKIDFIKCDVEGYETKIFPHLLKLIRKHQPLIQIEISSPENREEIFNLMNSIGYSPRILSGMQLYEMNYDNYLNHNGGDFYFSGQFVSNQ